MLISVVVLALLSAPAPAGAASIVALHDELAAGPALSGVRAIVVLHGPAGRGYHVEAIDPEGGEQSLGELPARYEAVGLTADASLIALQGVRAGCGDDPKCMLLETTLHELLVGPPSGPFSCAAGGPGDGSCARHDLCTGHEGNVAGQEVVDALEAVLASGSELAYESCGPGSGTGPGTTLLTGPTVAGAGRVSGLGRPLALAGEWIAGDPPGPLGPRETLVERNLASGAPVLSASFEATVAPQEPFPPVHIVPPEGSQVALREDGQLAYVAKGPTGNPSLWLASPSEPAPREVLEGNGASTLTDGSRVELHGTGLRIAEAQPGPELAVYTPCTESFLARWAPGEAAPALHVGACPTLRISPRRVRFARRSISVRATCPSAPPVGCPNARIETGVDRGAFYFDSPSVNLLAGETVTLTLPFGRRFVTWLHGHRGARIRLKAVVETDAGGDATAPDREIAVRVP